jgi:hypothetical protein
MESGHAMPDETKADIKFIRLCVGILTAVMDLQ